MVAVEKISDLDARRSPEKAGLIQSVDRAVAILEVISRSKAPISLSEIASAVEINSSTCHHIIKTLSFRKYIVAGEVRGTYALGPRVLQLASSTNWGSDLTQRAQPFIDHLNSVTKEAVHLAVLEGADLVTLIKREALHAVRVDAGSIGKSGACHATATGKAILAWLPQDRLNAVIEGRELRAFTERTITARVLLDAELDAIRKSGFAVDDEEFQPHVRCIGAPIFDHTGSVIGSISVSTPTFRANDDHMDLVRREVIAATLQLSGHAIEVASSRD